MSQIASRFLRNVRKTNKRKTNKRKTNKRKTNKRKTNKRKTNKRHIHVGGHDDETNKLINRINDLKVLINSRMVNRVSPDSHMEPIHTQEELGNYILTLDNALEQVEMDPDVVETTITAIEGEFDNDNMLAPYIHDEYDDDYGATIGPPMLLNELQLTPEEDTQPAFQGGKIKTNKRGGYKLGG